MIDLNKSVTAEQLLFFSDASTNPLLGFGATYGNRWLFAQWEPITLNNLVNNRRVFARHIRTEWNCLADVLSRLQFQRFWRLAPKTMLANPDKISPLVWPASRVWLHHQN